MSLQPGDALTSHNFGLQIDGVMVEYLAGGQRPDHDEDVIEFQQITANGQYVIKKLPGVKKAGEVDRRPRHDPVHVVQRLDQRLGAGRYGPARKNASILVIDYHEQPVKRYHLRNAWCSKVRPARSRPARPRRSPRT